MLLAIDSGNTTLVCALFDGNKLLSKWRINAKPKKSPDEIAVSLGEFLSQESLSFSGIKNIIISSVVPNYIEVLHQFSSKYLSCEPTFINHETDLGIGIDVDVPQEVGADRLVNAVAAYELFKKPSIVIDFGTATTFDYVGENGTYKGGVIAPGVQVTTQALSDAAAKLPHIEISKPNDIIGRSTLGAMQSGLYYGYVFMIEGIVNQIKKDYGESLYVIATGGDAELFKESLPVIDHIEPDLTLIGLQIIHERQKN